jgi:hypothetical protein
MKSIIITAADEKFAALCLRMIDSLLLTNDPPFDAIGVLDVGLSAETREKIQTRVTAVVTPAWDLTLDAALRETQPFLRAKTARPFLPRYFPGYDVYVWLDADTFLQERFALEWFLDAALKSAIGIVPQADPCYVHTSESISWRSLRLSKYYGDEAAALLASQPYYNGGAFSLRGDAPHWSSWARHFQAGLKACPWAVTDQTALNYAIWKDELPVHSLPTLCNWCWHLAAPMLNPETGKYCEPQAPHRTIGLIHMTARSKDLPEWNKNGAKGN